jgi:hypothetical protein
MENVVLEQSRFSLIEMKFAILRCFANGPSMQHRVNVLGRPYSPGALEGELGDKITPHERAIAGKAMRDLESDGLLRANYRDVVDPENWLEITRSGMRALSLAALDELDSRLVSIDSHLVEMRHGAWSAVHSSEPDSIRQAAHSAREMVTHILDKFAPQASRAKCRLRPSWKDSGARRTRRRRLWRSRLRPQTQYTITSRVSLTSLSQLRTSPTPWQTSCEPSI